MAYFIILALLTLSHALTANHTFLDAVLGDLNVSLDTLCQPHIPLCDLSSAQPRTPLSMFDAYAAVRKHRTLFVARDEFANSLLQAFVKIVSDGHISFTKDPPSNHLGSFQMTHATIPDSKQINWTFVLASASNMDTIIIYVNDSQLQRTNLTALSQQLESLEARIIILTALEPDESCGRTEASETRYKDLVEALLKLKDKLKLLLIWNIYEEECNLREDFFDMVSASLIQSFATFSVVDKLPSGQIAALIFFCPIIIIVLIMELIGLVARKANREFDEEIMPNTEEIELVTNDIGLDEDDENLHANSLQLGDNRRRYSIVKPCYVRLYNWYIRKNGRVVGWSFVTYALVLLLCVRFDHGASGFSEDDAMLTVHYRLRENDIDMFTALCLVSLVMAFRIIKSAEEKVQSGRLRILSRDQTEEWKGIMQIGFVLYHYFKAHQTYKLIRVYIAGYVWMTGFGNYFYFIRKRDFSLTRLIRMFWRINLFVIFLCIVMNNEYVLYYICPMHTFWFFVVYVTLLPLLKVSNENKRKESITVIICLILCFIVLSVLFEVREIFEFLMSPFRFLYFEGTLHEWYFRTNLDFTDKDVTTPTNLLQF